MPEKVCRARPALLNSHVAVLLGPMSRIDQPSVRCNAAQMVGHVKLSPRQRERAASLLRKTLDESSPGSPPNPHQHSSTRIISDGEASETSSRRV